MVIAKMQIADDVGVGWVHPGLLRGGRLYSAVVVDLELFQLIDR
jgi:hypothetical protein